MMTTEAFWFYKSSTLFDAQNTRNCILELLDFKFFWEAYPRLPFGKGDLPPLYLVVTATYYTFSGHL